jgi:DNA-binding NarL/FixJ family response regulator
MLAMVFLSWGTIMQRARIVLADDHPGVAEELRYLLDEAFDVVAVVGHGQALVTAATRLSPDAVVTDISMPGMDGMEAARQLLCARPDLGVIFVSVHDDPALARKALDIGRGYVRKASAGEELVDAIRVVLEGRVFVSASLGVTP